MFTVPVLWFLSLEAFLLVKASLCHAIICHYKSAGHILFSCKVTCIPLDEQGAVCHKLHYNQIE